MIAKKGPPSVRTHQGVIAVFVIPGIHRRVMEGVVKVTLFNILALFSLHYVINLNNFPAMKERGSNIVEMVTLFTLVERQHGTRISKQFPR